MSQACVRRAAQVTPLHTDPHHNLLAQVVGVKYVRLYPPAAAAMLCPFREGLTTNSSQARRGGGVSAPDTPPAFACLGGMHGSQACQDVHCPQIGGLRGERWCM
jgi:hypothetical protein